MAAGIPSHSVLIILVAGFMYGTGLPYPGAPILMMIGTGIPTAAAATILATAFSIAYLASSALLYYLGIAVGPLMERLLPEGVHDRISRLLERYGEFAVFWTRPLGIGNYISMPAGMMRMPLGRFLFYTLLGIWPWAFVTVFIGTYLGIHLAFLAKWLPYVGGILTVLALLAGVYWLCRRIRTIRNSR